MEGASLDEANVFITRDGTFVDISSESDKNNKTNKNGLVLQIHDAHFWLNEQQLTRALIQFKKMEQNQIEQYLSTVIHSSNDNNLLPFQVILFSHNIIIYLFLVPHFRSNNPSLPKEFVLQLVSRNQ